MAVTDETHLEESLKYLGSLTTSGLQKVTTERSPERGILVNLLHLGYNELRLRWNDEITERIEEPTNGDDGMIVFNGSSTKKRETKL